MSKNFYITTPIYYPSAKPHMGHAYSSIAADVIARFKKIEGYNVFFLTGTDEHGMKIQKAAEKKNKDPQVFCNEISKNFIDLTKILNLSNSDFIRTTEERHKSSVIKLWKLLDKNEQIYLSKYAGWYSVSDEAYYSEEEIEEIDGLKFSKSSNSSVEWMEEESFFFKLSEWQKPLLEFYDKNPGFIQPESRRNEVISFVSRGLKDLSISRTTFKWGIPVPNNSKHIIYVWLDALTNYFSAINFFEKKNNFWPANVHIIGKDILRFHAVYWPAFLMAAKLPLPNKIFGHGWILSGEEKMSKSKGNILDPIEIIKEYGSDELRYYLMKDVIFGLDGNINLDNFKKTINDLANNVGNLSNRIFTILDKNFNCRVPETSAGYTINENLLINKKDFIEIINNFELHNYLKKIHSYSSALNKYVNDNEPWNKKANSEQNIKNILYSTIIGLKNIFVLLYPITPRSSISFLKNINIEYEDISLDLINKEFKKNEKLSNPEILFKKYKCD
ncbi:MAG: methionine--tRNA ligase [Candidatus Pelagibacter sp.]|nr:methionine--tRNA ligase [Candidatus Pelagibacter sp.]|tara:strand:- start:22197 stop:23702 length:1506 start_codon:yes stop_codon:yes gene_type:complete